jgi:stress response protein YsnF
MTYQTYEEERESDQRFEAHQERLAQEADEMEAAAVGKHTFTVTVDGCTLTEAEQVMAERIDPDEDYGFDYRIWWVTT